MPFSPALPGAANLIFSAELRGRFTGLKSDLEAIINTQIATTARYHHTVSQLNNDIIGPTTKGEVRHRL